MPILGQRHVPQPKIVHTILPPYEIPDLIVIGCVVVENRGDAPAHNVKIVLEYEPTDGSRIRHLQIISDAEYILRGGGEHESFVTLGLRQLAPGKQVVVYFSGPNRTLPRVSVTHYEG